MEERNSDERVGERFIPAHIHSEYSGEERERWQRSRQKAKTHHSRVRDMKSDSVRLQPF